MNPSSTWHAYLVLLAPRMYKVFAPVIVVAVVVVVVIAVVVVIIAAAWFALLCSVLLVRTAWKRGSRTIFPYHAIKVLRV